MSAPSGSEVTSARSAGVKPIVVCRSARVATLTSTMPPLSTMLTPTTVRTFFSCPAGTRNQKLSVHPSPSASAKVLETMLRGVFSTNSSLAGTGVAEGSMARPTPSGSSSLNRFGSIEFTRPRFIVFRYPVRWNQLFRRAANCATKFWSFVVGVGFVVVGIEVGRNCGSHCS